MSRRAHYRQFSSWARHTVPGCSEGTGPSNMQKFFISGPSSCALSTIPLSHLALWVQCWRWSIWPGSTSWGLSVWIEASAICRSPSVGLCQAPPHWHHPADCHPPPCHPPGREKQTMTKSCCLFGGKKQHTSQNDKLSWDMFHIWKTHRKVSY